MRRNLAIAALVLGLLAGCAATVWHKPGASDAQFRSDARYCRGAPETIADADACMRGRGWSKTDRPGNPASTISGFIGTPDVPMPATNFLPPPIDAGRMTAPPSPEPTPMPRLPVYTPPPPVPVHCLGQIPIPGLAIGPDCP